MNWTPEQVGKYCDRLRQYWPKVAELQDVRDLWAARMVNCYDFHRVMKTLSDFKARDRQVPTLNAIIDDLSGGEPGVTTDPLLRRCKELAKEGAFTFDGKKRTWRFFSIGMFCSVEMPCPLGPRSRSQFSA